MKKKLYKLTGKELAVRFKSATGQSAPAQNKTYTCDTPSPIRPIAEYEPMGAALVAYIGTVAPDENHKQLPPSGERMFGVPDDLIVRMQQLGSKDGRIPKGDFPIHIFILCDDESEQPNIIANLQKAADEWELNFDPGLIHLIPWDTDTYWTRDYCPWWVKYKDTETDGEENAIYAISKHIYTSLGGGSVGMIEGAEEVNPREGSGIFRCNDDYGAVKISDYLNAPIRKWNKASWAGGKKLPQIQPNRWFLSGLLNVGGNYMVTSKGVIASSYLVAAQNELPTDLDPENPDAKDMDARMQYIMEQSNRFLGTNTYHVLTDPTGTYIGHIDCWGKFLTDDKVLITQSMDPKTNEGLDNIAQYFEEQGFHVYRVTAPNIYVPDEKEEPATTAPYTNSLILNKHVYVPLCGNQKYDNDAIQVYQEALGKDYTIEGIIGKKDAPWLGTDALHCRTNAIPKTVVDRWLKSQTYTTVSE